MSGLPFVFPNSAEVINLTSIPIYVHDYTYVISPFGPFLIEFYIFLLSSFQAATLLKHTEGIITLVVCNPKRDVAADGSGDKSKHPF